MLNEMNFETVYNVTFVGGFYIISLKGHDIDVNVCSTEKQFDTVFNDLCNITNFDDFYNYCCNHEVSLI